MKSYTQIPAPSKLAAIFDNQLMNISMEDLKAFSASNPNIRKVGKQQQQLLAA